MVRFWCAISTCRWIPRCAVADSAVANYSEPVALGAVMRSLAVGRVEESRSSDFHPGEYVTGMFGWQDYAVVDAEAIERKVGGCGLAHLDIAWRPRPRWDRLFRPPGDWPAQGGRDRGRVDGSGSGRVMRRSDRQDQGVSFPSALLAGLTRCVCVARSSATTPPSTTGPTILSQHSMLPALRASMSTSTTRPALSAIPSCDVSRSVHGWSSAARRPSRAGIRHPRDHGSSVIFSSNAHECRGFWSLTMSSAVPRRCGISRAGCATDRSAIARLLDGIEQAPGSIAGLYRGENLGKRPIRSLRMSCLETPSLRKPLGVRDYVAMADAVLYAMRDEPQALTSVAHLPHRRRILGSGCRV